MTSNILMVCLGNICRSPLAEGILQSKLDTNKFKIDSAGLGAWHVGKLPDKRSIRIASENQIDLTNQRARQFQQADFENFDLIFAMDQSVYSELISKAKNKKQSSKVKLMMDIVYPNQGFDVPDPYYDDYQVFNEVYNMLDKACNILAKQLQQ